AEEHLPRDHALGKILFRRRRCGLALQREWQGHAALLEVAPDLVAVQLPIEHNDLAWSYLKLEVDRGRLKLDALERPTLRALLRNIQSALPVAVGLLEIHH